MSRGGKTAPPKSQQVVQQPQPQQETRPSRRAIKTPSKYRDFDTQTVLFASPAVAPANVESNARLNSKNGSTTVDNSESESSATVDKIESPSAGSLAPLAVRDRRFVKTPSRLDDFQIGRSPAKREPPLTAANDFSSVSVKDDLPVLPATAAKFLPVQEISADSAAKKRRSRKTVSVATPQVKGIVAIDDDGEVEAPFCGFTDMEIERALSVRSGSSSWASLSSGRERRELKTPRKLADFDITTNIVGSNVPGQLKTKQVLGTDEEEEEVVDGPSKNAVEVDCWTPTRTAARRPSSTTYGLHKNKRGRPKAIAKTDDSLVSPALKGRIAIKSAAREDSQTPSLLSGQASDKENVLKRRVVGSQQQVLTCHMLQISADQAVLQPRRKRGRPPSKKSLESNGDNLGLMTSAATKLPRLSTPAGVTTLSSAAKMLSRGRGWPPTKRVVMAVVVNPPELMRTNTGSIKSGRWQIGKYVCQVCDRDCGYRQNLYLHMKRHVLRGEADASCLGKRRGRKPKNSNNDDDDRRADPTVGVGVRSVGPVLVVARKNKAAVAEVVEETEDSVGGESNQADNMNTPCRPR